MLVSITLVVGISLGVAAAHSWGKYCTSLDALCLLRNAPCPRFAKIHADFSRHDNCSSDELVIVRGVVYPWLGMYSELHPDKFMYYESVILERIQKIVHSGLIGILRNTIQLFGALNNNNILSYSLRTTLFELRERTPWPCSTPNIVVQLDGSSQPLPLTTQHRNSYPTRDSTSSLLSYFLGKVSISDELNTLPIGKTITAVGTCRKRKRFLFRLERIVEIRPSNKLPYFLSNMTKTEMVSDLTVKTNLLLGNSILMGSVSLGLLVCGTVRIWWRRQEFRRARQHTHELNDSIAGADVDVYESNEATTGTHVGSDTTEDGDREDNGDKLVDRVGAAR